VAVGGSVSNHVRRGIIEHALAAMAVIGALALGGCAVETGFPAVHDMPAPRTETTLTPDQVKQATDSLISERDQLQTNAQPIPPVQAAEAPATPAKKKPATVATTKPAAPAATDDETGATAIGAYAKP
jgi:sialic acid synthase SpsE